MGWPVPEFNNSEINRAGFVLKDRNSDFDSTSHATMVLNQWRACHGYPINTFQSTLRNKLSRIDKDAIVAQRLKRTPSIINKLCRNENMKLSTMQDIGGIRAIVSNIAKVKEVADSYRTKRCTHKLVRENDYINFPKGDGYRSFHMIFRYLNIKAPEYANLSVELQIRTKLQHAWATAVEILDTFSGKKLKSGEGEGDWSEFFQLAGSAFAYIENTERLDRHRDLSEIDTYRMVKEYESKLGVINKLQSFSLATKGIMDFKSIGYYFLIKLDADIMNYTVWGYPKNKPHEATEHYAELEKAFKGDAKTDVVLASISKVAQLRKAYPNYFLDSAEFVSNIRKIISSVPK